MVITSTTDFTTESYIVVECANGYSSDGTVTGRTQAFVHCDTDFSHSWTASAEHTSPTVDLQCQLITHTITGRVTDAQNGRPVEGATVSITNAQGATSQTHTDPSGHWIMQNAPGGETALQIEADAYIGVAWVFNVDADVYGGRANQAISRVLTANAWRAVLTWTTETRDLDTHVHHIPATGEERDRKLWWANRHVAKSTGVTVVLDRDAVQFHQVPETATFENINQSPDGDVFAYRVWDWCSSANMVASGARVDVYNENYLFGSYNIGQAGVMHGHNGVDNLRWDVFQIRWDASQGLPVVEECDGTNCGPDDSTTQSRNHNYC